MVRFEITEEGILITVYFGKECHLMVVDILLDHWLMQLIEILDHLKTSKMHFPMLLQLNLVRVGLGYVYMMEEN